MNAWPFITAAYAITFAGTAAIALGSYISMRRAERDADALGRR